MAERREAGSSLMLMPAAVLVVIILGAIAVDQSIVYTRQRELVAAAEAAANDAAGYGLDRDAFYQHHQIELDPARARAAAVGALRARGLDDAVLVSLHATGDAVEVELATDVSYLFADAVPGAPDHARVRASASAQLRRP
jgi:uncharacterized membrane protein